ncbi:MAG: exodeoxyribonuclease VII large subunit [Blastocatellia bacterium AA13]|nr:MAG: exodeoxyribonuclease VII large subunit [Blastocatellia bacterium AA13]
MSQLSFLDQLTRQRRALSVSELTSQLKDLIEGNYFNVWVEGEVSNFRRHSSGHWYFTLKDELAQLRCACFKTQNRLVRFSPEDGMAARVRGRLSVYEARGEYQMVVETIEPTGAGALQLAFEQLKAKLAAEGFFDLSRKRPLPLFPRRVGLVTSPTGAAIRDILRTLRRRSHTTSVLIAPARVQGEGAAHEIAGAIATLNSIASVDVIIIGRGGGSIEDLWCFNEEVVARAVFLSRTPVIAAIGHETDFTIADFTADLRASTPSAAAEIVSATRNDLIERIRTLDDRIRSAVSYDVADWRNRLFALHTNRAFEGIRSKIGNLAQRVDEAAYKNDSSLRNLIRCLRSEHHEAALKLERADIRRTLALRRSRLEGKTARLLAERSSVTSKKRERFQRAAGKLDSLSPLAVLGRGYAIAFDRDGCVIKRAADIDSGEQVRVRVDEGEIDCVKQ